MIYSAYSDQKQEVLGITLVSCGHIFAKPGREIYRPNGRDDWLLFYIAKGTEIFYFDKTLVAEEGSFVLYAPHEKQHHICSGTKNAEFYYLHFKCNQLPENIGLDTSKIYRLIPKRQICDVFEEIIDETLEKRDLYERLCIYKFLYLLTKLERETENTNALAKDGFKRIALAVQHMNKNYNSNYTLADYAALCNMSKYHFLRQFFEVVGHTPLEYRNNIRLEHAAELLREEKLSVEEVSNMVGYTTASYFSVAFKQKFGISPKQYSLQKS